GRRCRTGRWSLPGTGVGHRHPRSDREQPRSDRWWPGPIRPPGVVGRGCAGTTEDRYHRGHVPRGAALRARAEAITVPEYSPPPPTCDLRPLASDGTAPPAGVDAPPGTGAGDARRAA